ncbi:hypothetical protein D0Z00_003981 [Geotrichum galactomycetum]|uniref:Uncharacterized protein n=1 Tax=Geotrichum galactomycetum TaxID=27317 RepID=A0ACB6UZT1_9ASCO|nr:hypothetical protein D0Z00_003981 [Geotrichum candidum]
MDNNDEDEYLYGSEPSAKKQKTEEVPEYEDDSDDESIEFIINSKPGEKAEAPQQQGPYSNVAPTAMTGTDKSKN